MKAFLPSRGALVLSLLTGLCLAVGLVLYVSAKAAPDWSPWLWGLVSTGLAAAGAWRANAEGRTRAAIQAELLRWQQQAAGERSQAQAQLRQALEAAEAWRRRARSLLDSAPPDSAGDLQDRLQDLAAPEEENTWRELASCLGHSGVLLESYHKFPYLQKFIRNTIQKTETATLELLERFVSVNDEVGASNREAAASLAALQGGHGRKGFQELVQDSRGVILAFDRQTKELAQFNKTVTERFLRITKGIDEIRDNLGSIVEISEQNNIISINSSIEASKLGRQGAGFKVLVGEILKSNERTNAFITDINTIVMNLKEMNDQFLERWREESTTLLANLDQTRRFSDDIIGALAASHESTSQLFLKLSTTYNRVQERLAEILTSLQFQDITRQQLENVLEFLGAIREDLRVFKPFFALKGHDLDHEDPAILDKVRREFLKKAKVIDERELLGS